MPSERSYLDHNATSPLRPEARAAMFEAMDLVGNPSSVHAEGRAAKALMERARRQVASLCGAKPEQVVFTSGGTEALCTVVWMVGVGAVWSDLEHAAVLGPLEWGLDPNALPENIVIHASGLVDVESFVTIAQRHYNHDALLVLQCANNETGVLQPVRELSAFATKGLHRVLTDAVQVAGKSALNFSEMGVNYMVISGHKIGAPKGVGAIFRDVRSNDEAKVIGSEEALFRGGGQERGMRAGTENLIGIAGFGASAEAAERDLDDFAKLADWRDEIEAAVAKQTSDAVVIAQSSPRLPNTSCIALPGVPAETLVMALDLEGIAVSAGSACSSGKVTRSHVLEAMGFPDEVSGSAIRVSLGWNSSKKDVDHFMKAWATVTDRLARR